jgi:K+-sensing histidine kinase KdpD
VGTRILTNPISFRQVGLVERYSIAIATAVLAILLRWLLDPVLGHVAFYVTVYATVAFCALFCGLGPAIVTTILGFLGIYYWFVDPRLSFAMPGRTEIHGIIGCFLVCGALLTLGEMSWRKEIKLNDAVRALLLETRERQRAEEELQKAHDELEGRVEERTADLLRALGNVESEVTERKQA